MAAIGGHHLLLNNLLVDVTVTVISWYCWCCMYYCQTIYCQSLLVVCVDALLRPLSEAMLTCQHVGTRASTLCRAIAPGCCMYHVSDYAHV